MNNLVTSFAHYAGQTADKMGIPKEETIVRACVELMFNVMREQGSTAAIRNPLEQNLKTVEATIQWIKPRYEAIKRYYPDFFRDHPDADKDAVTVAMLCTGYTHFAHVLADNGGDVTKPTEYKNDSIPWGVLERAEEIIDQAENIAAKVMDHQDIHEGERPASYSLESIFVAHGFLSDILYGSDAGEGFQDYSRKDFQYLKDNILGPIRKFARLDTNWGQDIVQQIDAYEIYLDGMIVEAPEPSKPRFVPTLVYSAPV